MGHVAESWVARITFSMISLIAFMGNALVILVFIRKRKTIKRSPFDALIINLALTDLTTAIFLVFSRFLYLPTMPDAQPDAFLICNILWGGYILFGLGYVSVYTCLLLTIDRWLAVVKPHLYRRLNMKHTTVIIIVVWMWAFFINSTVFLSVTENFQEGKCEWKRPKIGNIILPLLEISVACIIPFSVTILLYLHISFKIKRISMFSIGARVVRKRLTIIAFVASIALIVGWLPTKISYMMRFTSVGAIHLQGTAHFVFIMMSLGNSCVNPILYGICSSKFRREYWKILNKIVCK